MENSNQPEEQEDGGATFSTTMQKGSFGFSPAKTRKRKKTEVAQARGGGARIIRPGGRKDRHSKVCTARGTRDRRVRLAPKTAIDFYDVQDRLGYDRPSKAIDWLMNEAKAAIAALDEPPPPPPPDLSVAKIQQNRTGNDDYNEGSFGILKSNSPPAGFATPAAPGGGETFDATLEMAKMQRIFAWNYGSAPVTPHSNLGHGQNVTIREPLQSSYSRIANYYPMSARFPGIEFSNEELTIPENNEMDNSNSNNYYYPASFLQYEH